MLVSLETRYALSLGGFQAELCRLRPTKALELMFCH